ncbi:diaminopimelate epimerase [Sphingomonas sp. Leaf208]|jgi:diaminopimelate epimerase|uniref:diaminopimelate epimerase n=1 Tax=Sphingomonas sp. Leaf208 TaxID=1735679 RepID=UPI0007014103|nr:diaminopimelate epimerase [Sphingomonas sp. Leaf208]KQM49038.1 diaminopimelate epimerase [Sphingomonas sp. Leaf208]
MRFDLIKCHGSGNDFPLIDARASTLGDAAWAAVARALADREGPVGGDGLLLLTAGDDTHAFGMRMFNSDGSESETCLNGLRCVARAGFAATGSESASALLKISDAAVERDADIADGVFTVREIAGPASLDVAAWPMAVGTDRFIDAPIANLPTDRAFTAVAMPNPHLVTFVNAIDEAELVRVGEACEAAPDWLPNRANVSFVEVRGRDLFVRTFERGVGLTDSCGSAMAASTYAACLTGRIAYDTPTTVFNKGGLVRAEASEAAMVTLSGNATFEWTGSVEVDLDTAIASDLVVTRRHDDEIAAWAGLLAAI